MQQATVSTGSKQPKSAPYSSILPTRGGSGSAARCRPSTCAGARPAAGPFADAPVLSRRHQTPRVRLTIPSVMPVLSRPQGPNLSTCVVRQRPFRAWPCRLKRLAHAPPREKLSATIPVREKPRQAWPWRAHRSALSAPTQHTPSVGRSGAAHARRPLRLRAVRGRRRPAPRPQRAAP